ncbi:SAM-dependent methyltransferase [Nocardia sp. NPDC058518]|uniref:SAM-dependent methyltransferase n=1 Tax=Nocardia sp. NPDC058518 TaxID=3346534 RepID=UPI0036542BD0
MPHPHPARVHNALLGGKDSHEPDRLLAETMPKRLRVAVHESRRFAVRAVEHLVTEHQVTQIVDLGCGLPWAPDIGDVATGANENARTLYIDNDRFVATYARALLVTPNASFAEADLTDTAAVLDHIAAVMDMSAPMAVCLSGTAELLAEAPAVLADLTRGLPAGSWLVLSHITGDLDNHAIARAAEDLCLAGIGYYPRSEECIRSMLAPYTLLEPGLVGVHWWRPEIDHHHVNDTGVTLHPVPDIVSAYAAVGQLEKAQQC